MGKDVNISYEQPDWKLTYPPELVGEYLVWHEQKYPTNYVRNMYGEITAALANQYQPNLNGFLVWCYERKTRKD